MMAGVKQKFSGGECKKSGTLVWDRVREVVLYSGWLLIGLTARGSGFGEPTSKLACLRAD